MKRFLWLVPIMATIACTQVFAGANPYGYTELGYQQLSSLASATGLTVPAGTSYALICVETQAIRWRDDGTDPTATIGMPVPSGSCFSYYASLGKIKFIQQAASASISVSYYK